jgi:hypothetical protein
VHGRSEIDRHETIEQTGDLMVADFPLGLSGRNGMPRHETEPKRCSGLALLQARRPLAVSLGLMYLETKRFFYKETS